MSKKFGGMCPRVWNFSSWTYRPGQFPWQFPSPSRTYPPDGSPDNFPPHLGHFPPDNSPDNIPPHRTFPPDVKAKIWKLALTRTHDPNRSTCVNFVHVNGRSIYIVDRRRLVGDQRNVHYVQREMYGWISSGEYAQAEMSGSRSPGSTSWNRPCRKMLQ